jgi:hypothetical protein
LDVDGVVPHAHPGDRSQLRLRQHVARERLDAGQHRIHAIQERQQVLPLDRVAARRRIDDLEAAAQEDLRIVAGNVAQERGRDQNTGHVLRSEMQ